MAGNHLLPEEEWPNGVVRGQRKVRLFVLLAD